MIMRLLNDDDVRRFLIDSVSCVGIIPLSDDTVTRHFASMFLRTSHVRRVIQTPWLKLISIDGG